MHLLLYFLSISSLKYRSSSIVWKESLLESYIRISRLHPAVAMGSVFLRVVLLIAITTSGNINILCKEYHYVFLNYKTYSLQLRNVLSNQYQTSIACNSWTRHSCSYSKQFKNCLPSWYTISHHCSPRRLYRLLLPHYWSL